MRSGPTPFSSTITRRGFLKRAGAVAGLAPAISDPLVATGLAQTKTLRIIQWSHFVPQFDTWFDGFAKDWGKKNGITVTVVHIPHLEIPARAAAEVAAGAGHDLIMFSGYGGPPLFDEHFLGLRGLLYRLEKKEGKVEQIVAPTDSHRGRRTTPADTPRI